MIKLILVEMQTGATADMDLQPHFWEQDAETIADNVAMLKDQLYTFNKKEGVIAKPVQWEKTPKDKIINQLCEPPICEKLTYEEEKQIKGDHPLKDNSPKPDLPF